tara:strand:+ start:34 stop:648 length:615 start_codon:yes stop_codon:yes gene_type:complete
MAITLDGTTGISSVDGSAASPSVRGSDSNSGIVYDADAIKFSTGGTQRAVIDNNGLSSAGHILQVIQTSTTSTHTNTTTSYADTGLTGSITPSSSSNKILITISQPYHMHRLNTNAGGSIQLLRDSTVIYNILNGEHGFFYYVEGTSEFSMYAVYNVTYLDSPSTTSAITYKTQDASYVVSNSGKIVTQPASAKSLITLMEVSG